MAVWGAIQKNVVVKGRAEASGLTNAQGSNGPLPPGSRTSLMGRNPEEPGRAGLGNACRPCRFVAGSWWRSACAARIGVGDIGGQPKATGKSCSGARPCGAGGAVDQVHQGIVGSRPRRG